MTAKEDIFSEKLYGLIYNWKGLKEENSVYTAEQLAELDDGYEPTAKEFEGAIAANKTYTVYLLNGSNREETMANVRAFMTGEKNDDPIYNGEGWYWETVTENFFTGYINPTTQRLIAELHLEEAELRMQEPTINHTVFEYGGFHFVPERTLTNEESDIKEIARHQRIDTDLGFSEKGYDTRSKHEYSHADFYAASTDKNCDLFRCVENGKLYLPCTHDLQEYVTDDPKIAGKNVTNYRQIVIDNVTEEYADFRETELKKPKEQIYEDYYKIHVYEELKEFLLAQEPQMDDAHYRSLAADGKSVLALLYDDYLSREYSSITTWEDICDFVTTYNEKYHEDILEQKNEME